MLIIKVDNDGADKRPERNHTGVVCVTIRFDFMFGDTRSREIISLNRQVGVTLITTVWFLTHATIELSKFHFCELR